MRYCIVVVCLLSVYLLFSYTNKLNRKPINMVHRRVAEPLMETQNIVDNHEDVNKLNKNPINKTSKFFNSNSVIKNKKFWPPSQKSMCIVSVAIKTETSKFFHSKLLIKNKKSWITNQQNLQKQPHQNAQ